MAWAKGTSGSDAFAANGASIAAACGAVSIGDVICVGVTLDQSAGHTTDTGSVTDNLGNAYVRAAAYTDTTNQQRIEIWWTPVTHAGTPTVTVQYNPIPGTTHNPVAAMTVDPFTGSTTGSVLDNGGVGAAQGQLTPGTGTDGVSSGNMTTTNNGCLIYAVSVNDSALGTDPGAIGTGFTLGIFENLASNIWIRSEYLAQGAAGTIAGTFTSATNTAHITAALAITPTTPASAQTFTPDDDGFQLRTMGGVGSTISLFG